MPQSVLEDLEGNEEAIASFRTFTSDKKSPKEKKEEECCGKHKEGCRRVPDARRIPGIKRKK